MFTSFSVACFFCQILLLTYYFERTNYLALPNLTMGQDEIQLVIPKIQHAITYDIGL